MRMKRAVVVGAASVMLLAGWRAGWGEAVPEPVPVAKAISDAEMIVVGSIVKFTEDPEADVPKGVGGPVILMSVNDFVTAMTFKRAGTYRLKVEKALKGQADGEVEAHLPALSAFFYRGTADPAFMGVGPLAGVFRKTPFPVDNESRVMLMLRKKDGKTWEAVDALRPMIPLAKDPEAAPGDNGGEKNVKYDDAIGMMLLSMAEERLRPTLAHILMEVEEERMAPVMRKYADDEDVEVRSDVLFNLGVNQDVEAIPKIASLARELEREKKGGGPVGALSRYKTAKAVEFLNPLIADESYFIRLNAILSLGKLADRSSIPYLMKALEMEDSQANLVSYSAYCILHNLESSLGPPRPGDFNLHREEEIQVLKRWWEGEQAKAGASTKHAGETRGGAPGKQ